jgi:UDP-N-acetylglucosamine 2-epimerase
MDRVFFEQLELPEARYNLDVGSGTHGEQTGKILIGVESIMQKEKPDVVLVEGDTNTVLAGALAATKQPINPFRVFGDMGGAHDAGALAEPVMGQSPYKGGACRGRFEKL